MLLRTYDAKSCIKLNYVVLKGICLKCFLDIFFFSILLLLKAYVRSTDQDEHMFVRKESGITIQLTGSIVFSDCQWES